MKIGWSFCIITSEGNDSVLKQSINSILQEFSGTEDFEIIIVGKSTLKNDFLSYPIHFFEINERFLYINFSPSNLVKAIKTGNFERLIYKPGPISHKKNYAAKQSSFNKLCFLHDYVALEPGWKNGFIKFKEPWEACMNIVLNQDNSRYRDWCTWDYPNVGRALLPYDSYVKEMYFSGAYFCVKQDFFLNNMLNEDLFWGEGEDTEWSIRVRDKTTFKMNINASVKFIKLKSLTSSPYNKGWVNNTKKLAHILTDLKSKKTTD